MKYYIFSAIAATAIMLSACGTPSPESAAKEAIEIAQDSISGNSDGMYGEISVLLKQQRFACGIVYEKQRRDFEEKMNKAMAEEDGEKYMELRNKYIEFNNTDMTAAQKEIKAIISKEITPLTNSLLGKELNVVYDAGKFSSAKLQFAEFNVNKWGVMMAKITGVAVKARNDVRVGSWNNRLIFEKGKTSYDEIFPSSYNNFPIKFTNITPDMVQFVAEVPVDERADYDIVKLVID